MLPLPGIDERLIQEPFFFAHALAKLKSPCELLSRILYIRVVDMLEEQPDFRTICI